MTTSATTLRALLCLGVTPAFFSGDDEERGRVVTATKEAFADLEGRFGVRVISTFDDDTLQVGQSSGFPWTAYLLLEAPSSEAVQQVTDLFRQQPVGQYRLWRYYSVECRLGRKLFFGED